MKTRFEEMVRLLKGVRRRYREGGLNNVITYTISRFYTVRSLCRFYYHCVGRRNSYDLRRSMFQGIRAGEVLDAVRRRALFMGLNLPKADADAVLRYAKRAHCWSPLGNGSGRHEYAYAQKAGEERRLGQRFILAHYEQPRLLPDDCQDPGRPAHSLSRHSVPSPGATDDRREAVVELRGGRHR